MLVTLLASAQAEAVMESLFRVKECNQSPVMMRVFQVEDLTSYSPAVNEIWSPFYSLILQEYLISECGTHLSGYMDGSCCFNAMAEVEGGFISGYEIPLNDMTDAIPKTAIGQSYCHVQKAQDSLLAYEQVWYLSNGECLEQTRCLANQTLQRFSDAQCTQLQSWIDLKQSNTLHDTAWGNTTVGWTTWNQGTVTNGWNAFTPSN